MPGIMYMMMVFKEEHEKYAYMKIAKGGNRLRSIPFLMSGHLNFNFFKLWVRHFSIQISIMDAQI